MTAEPTFNAEQQIAVEEISNDYMQYLQRDTAGHNVERMVVGAAGRGKTFTVSHIINRLDAIEEVYQYVNGVEKTTKRVGTAMTNQATNVLREFLKENSKKEVECFTPYILLSLKVWRDWKTGKTGLKDKEPHEFIYDSFILVDEAVMLDKQVHNKLREKCKNCFIIYVLDDWQILNVSQSEANEHIPYIMTQGIKKYELTEPMRFGNNSCIHQVTEAFLDMIKAGHLKPFSIDNVTVQHRSRNDFEAEIIKSKEEFLSGEAKVIGWRNNTVALYNQGIMRELLHRDHFAADDLAVMNEFMMMAPHKHINDESGKYKPTLPIPTNATVKILEVSQPFISAVGQTLGRKITFEYYNDTFTGFLPADVSRKKEMLRNLRKLARSEGFDPYSETAKQIRQIDFTWIDLRPAFAMTADKSQGSTFTKVFIDLDDFSAGLFNFDSIARRLYVATSRPTTQLIFTGEL